MQSTAQSRVYEWNPVQVSNKNKSKVEVIPLVNKSYIFFKEIGRLPRGMGGDIFDTSACDRLTFLGEVLETSLVHVAQGVLSGPLGQRGPPGTKPCFLDCRVHLGTLQVSVCRRVTVGTLGPGCERDNSLTEGGWRDR